MKFFIDQLRWHSIGLTQFRMFFQIVFQAKNRDIKGIAILQIDFDHFNQNQSTRPGIITDDEFLNGRPESICFPARTKRLKLLAQQFPFRLGRIVQKRRRIVRSLAGRVVVAPPRILWINLSVFRSGHRKSWPSELKNRSRRADDG